jgi:hypothetical protein
MKPESLVVALFLLSLVAGAVWLLGLSGIAAIFIAIGLGLNVWWVIVLLAPGEVIFVYSTSTGIDRDACTLVLAASAVGVACIGLEVKLLTLA